MTNVYFNLNQREEMARNLWYKRSNATGNSVSVDSSTDGGTTLAEYPGNHPVITQLSPRNHPLWDAIWKHVAMIFAVLVMSIANIGTAWGTSGIITAASTTDLGKGNTPRYVVEQAGVGRLMKNATGNSSWSASDGKLTTGSSKFALQTYNAISSIVINGYGTGSGRTFSSMRVGTTTGNYAAATATGTGTMSSTESSQTITITPSSTIAANSYVEITLSGNIYIYSVELVYASSCAATANAGADKSTTVGVGVAMAATAASSGYTGAWSIKAGSPSMATSQLSSTSSATATFTPTAAGTYTLVWTVTDNSDGTCSASDEATVTVSAPVVTHDITYTNLKGADNSANPTTYTEGVGVASFANLRHVVGYDFTGWSPSSISSSATTNQTIDAQWTARAAATGTGTLTYALAFESSIITTSSITRNNGALYDATNISTANTSFVSGGEAPGNGCSGKLATTSSKSGSNYVELTFKIADGYTFTPSGVSIRANAVSNNKTLEVELKDNAASPHTKSVTAELAAGSTSGGVTYNLDFSSSPVTLEGTVTLKIYVYGSSGATKGWRIGPSVIVNGTVASTAPSCTAPTSPSITPSNGWLYVPGEEITLTASASNTDASTTYTWYRGSDLASAKAAGAIQATKTSAQGGTTYTIASCTASDAYKYWCEISNGTGCEASASYDIKLYTFFLYNNDNSNNSSHAFTYIDRTNKKLSVTFDVSNATYTYYFKVSDGLGTWYGKNSSTITSATNYCDGLNSSGANVGLTTTLAGSYTVDYYYESNNVVVTYPVPNQTAGQTVYFDNTLTQMSNMYIRIGSTTYSNASSAFTAVPGTAALYQGSTIAWDGFAAWSIADNTGWTGENSIYQPWNGQWTGTGNDYQMSKQTDYQNYAVSGAVTIVPTALHNSEYNCQYYNVDKYNGMLRDRVTITAPVNGTITVNYTSEEGVASSFSATTVDMNQDLAHTVIITPTATPAEGYTLSGLTVNGAAHTSGNTYTVTANTTIAATFSPASYTVTLNTNDGTINAGNVTSYTYGTGATLPTNVTKSGFTFGGWYDNSGLTGSAVTSISSSATGNKEFWAKWTLDSGCKTWAGTPSSWTSYKMTIGSTLELETNSDAAAAINTSSNNEVWSGHTETVIALAGSGQYVQGHFTDGSNINTVTVSAANNQNAGNNYKYVIIFCANSSFSSGVTGQTHAAPSHADAQNDAKLVHEFTAPAGTKYFRIYRKVEAIGGYEGGGDGKTTRVYRIEVCPMVCSTPDAPTSPTNGATTSTTQAVSWTDAANSQWEVYVSTSSSTPAANVTPTASPTTASYTFEGLTASTTYYWWVRSVCDASHKSSWVAGTSFTTSAAEPDPLVHWTMNLNTSTWGAASTETSDGTNITSIATSQTAGDTGNSAAATAKTSVASAEVTDNSSPSNSANFTFTVNSAKKVVPEKVTCQVFNVGSAARNYKAQIIDNNGHVYNSTNTLNVTAEATLTDATFNFAAGGVLVGNVTLKVYAWGGGSYFRMGQHVKFYGEVQNAADYTVTHTMSNVTKSAGATSVKEGNNYTATYAGAGGYALPSTITVTIGGSPATAGTDYTWTQGTGVVTIPGNKVTGNIVITVTGVAPAPTYSVTHSLTNVTATSGATGASAATEGVAYNAVFAANTGYVLPSTITVTIGGSPATVGTGYTWNSSTGAFQVPAAQVTGDIVVTIAGETAPSTKDIYYGQVKITDGALVREIPSGAVQFFTNIGGTVANTTEISLSSTPSTGGIYYNSNNLTDAELSKSSNWGTSSGSNRYVRGLKFANGATYTLALGTKVASTITFYGWCGSASKTMTVGDEEFTSSSTKNTFAKHEFIKTGGFTGNVSITQDGDFYGILVITIQTATPCTTPVIPTLSNQSLCEGADIAAWNATPTNASTITGKGETVTYSWKKKGNATELANTASFDLGASAAESQGGTYVVTVTVSKAGKASATATKEVTLTVNEATEVTAITADKATVYPTNNVTLTATANMDATWQWYTCTNSAGDGEDDIDGATSASYTIASAPAAGTYYYKVKATGGCGTGSMVYTLTVSAAAGGDCFHYVSVLPDKDISPSSGASIVTPTHATTLEGGTMKVGSQQITITKNGLKLESSKSVSITLDNALEAGNVVIVKGTSATAGYGVTINGVNFYEADSKTFDVSYTVLADDGLVGKTALTVTKYSGSSYLQEIKITGCGTSCTDPEVTASADNTTACVGTSVTFTAANAHASATYQWQKLNGTWTNISGATESTYNIASVVAGDAGKYRVIASHACNRTSNEVTLSVPTLPDFGSTVPASVSVMQTIALSINTVEATDAVKYRWYKSADATWNAGDTEIGTNKELIKAYDSEAIGSPSYYIFCRAQNACGITTSTAIAVNVTEYVEEDCATKGNEDDAEFGFENTGCSQGTYSETAVWTTNSRSKYLTYTAPEGKYLKTAKVTVAVSSGSKCGYAYSTDGGTTWTYAELASLSSTLTEKTINLNSLSGTINAFRISRNLQDGGGTDHGVTSGNFYLSKACFEYTDACTATTVTVSPTSKTYTIGNSWTAPTITLGPVAVASETLTYTSSDEDIATVDDDGTVNFQGRAGSVTITASYAGGEVGLTDYCASEGSYTITVSCSGDAPKIVEASTVDLSGCNSSVVLNAKEQDGTTDFTGGSYQWLRNGEEIDGATNKSYTATQAGIYTVEYTSAGGCTSVSTNSAVVTSETTEPEVERLVPFQYYHVDKTYTAQMKMRHLFAVKNSGKLDGKSFKLYVSRNGNAATDVTSSNALEIWTNADGRVDTVMVDMNKLNGKYTKGDELVYTCKAIDCSGNISETYTSTITMNVIDTDTATLALICSGASGDGTRTTSKLVVGGDFLTGYNKADLCVQTGKTSFDKTQEWVLYTRLKENYIVTPVNGYAPFNKLNYEPFDILFLTDYPKASKSDAAATILDDMADLCDYRPLFTFKTHMVHKSPSKWAAKGFMAQPEVPKQSRQRLNIVCYAHPMFDDLKETSDYIQKDASDHSQIVYTMLTGAGHEGGKGMQGFPIDAVEGFVTIGLVHYDATAADDTPSDGYVTWTSESDDVMMVAAAERQVNLEARMILFSINCGAQSKLTETGRQVVLRSLEYLLSDATITPVADCSFTFTNGVGNPLTQGEYESECPSCTGTIGDGKWSTAGNWGPDWILQPGKDTEVKIAAPVTVDMQHAKVRTVRILEGGSIDIPAGSGLEVGSTIRRLDGTEISPTEVGDIHIGSASTGNGTLIFNNNSGDTKARVDMYSKGFIEDGVKNYQYIGTPFKYLNAVYNYYGSWIYSWGIKKNGNWGWVAVKNGGPMSAWTGYCITQESPAYYETSGTMTETGTVDIAVPAGNNMVVGNSWTAPIDINALTTDDLEGLVANIYFFNTGVDKKGTAGAAGSRYAGGTYVTVPVEAARYTGDDDHINSMQGFFVKNTGGSDGTLHLDYDRHVRGTTRGSIIGDALHAPKRAKAASDEPAVLKIKVSGENYDDKLLLLAREDFSMGFDNGWDGDKWDGNESALYIYTKDEAGTENSVSAIPEMEGTVIGFRAGEDDAYTLHFEYLNSAEELYLFDTETNAYTKIMTGATYRFFTDDKEKHERFIITRKSPQIATDVDEVDSGKRREVRKLLIEDKMYILVNGMLYDATGKVVK